MIVGVGVGILFTNGKKFLPNDISNLNIWLDATRIVNKADGQIIDRWKNHGSSEIDVIQTVVGNHPTLKTNSKNGLPAVYFDGINDTLQSEVVQTFNQPDTLVFVFENTGKEGILCETVLTNYQYVIVNFNGVPGNVRWFAGTSLESVGGVLRNGWNILTVKANGINTQIRVNGTLIKSGDGGSMPFEGLLLGDDSAIYNNFFKGGIGEVLVYKKLLADNEINVLEKHLSTKWNIALN